MLASQAANTESCILQQKAISGIPSMYIVLSTYIKHVPLKCIGSSNFDNI